MSYNAYEQLEAYILGAKVPKVIRHGPTGHMWYDYVPKLKHIKKQERRDMESEEKKRFRSFAERYVVARAHLFPVENEMDAAWQCMLMAKTAYKMINGAGVEFEPVPDAANSPGQAGCGTHGPVGVTGVPGNPWQAQSRLHRASGVLSGNHKPLSQPAIAAKVAAIKAADIESGSSMRRLFEKLDRKGKSWMK
jgi:hypothetical protein